MHETSLRRYQFYELSMKRAGLPACLCPCIHLWTLLALIGWAYLALLLRDVGTATKTRREEDLLGVRKDHNTDLENVAGI